MSAQRPDAWSWLPPDDPWHTAVAWSRSTPNSLQILRVAAAELAIGRTARSQTLLDRYGPGVVDSVGLLAIRAGIALRVGKPATAATFYVAAARRTSGREAGVLLARAGAAYERAGASDSAARCYERARALLPEIAGWLGLREARLVRDSATAEPLLALAPPAAANRVLAVRARLRLLVGDMTGAEQLLMQAGRPAEAAALALARGDSAVARESARLAVTAGDTTEVRRALALLGGPLPPRMPDQWMDAARAAARLGDPAAAARYAERAATAGDRSPPTLLAWGDWLERAGRLREALRVYASAGRAGAFPRARVLQRLGERPAALRALLDFGTRYPEDSSAAAAIYLAAEIADRDSLFEVVALRWPAHRYASRARSRLATERLTDGDTAAAVAYYTAEIGASGPEANRARYHVGRLRLAGTAADSARAALFLLARDDSLGYYGLLARQLLGMEPPRLPMPEARAPSPGVQALLLTLAWLDAAGFPDDARLLVQYAVAEPRADADELLDLAMGLTASGRAAEGIRLAWRAAGRLSLNHPRVLRAVFPWPTRERIEEEAAEFGLDPYLLAGLIRQESGFAPAARSRAGARGYTQLMSETARGVARRLSLPWTGDMAEVVDANIHLGAAHLAGLLARYGGSTAVALAAYNAGGRPVDRWLRQPSAREPESFVERIGFPETQGYVRTVLRNQWLYGLLYPPEHVAP